MSQDPTEVVLEGLVLVEVVKIEVDLSNLQGHVEKAVENQILTEVGNLEMALTVEDLGGLVLVEDTNMVVLQWMAQGHTEEGLEGLEGIVGDLFLVEMKTEVVQ